MKLPERLINQLNKRKEEDSFRSLKTVEGLIDFSSNDYLGLARNKELLAQKYNVEKLGATGSRLLAGNSKLVEEIEDELAASFSAEAALIYNSGYTANLGVLSAIPQRGDLILYDELSHASIKDGMRLSLATKKSFRHNDMNDLKQELEKGEATNNTYVIVESIYSMDGDECHLKEIIKLCEQNNALLILDEAHATGILGARGGGLSKELGVEDQIFCRIYTFGKAMGCHGAAVAGSNELISFLINFSRPFIYTTALPEHNLYTIRNAFRYIEIQTRERQSIRRNISHYSAQFQEKIGDKFERTQSTHAIQTVIIPGNSTVKRVSDSLVTEGFDIRPILSPTVPEGKERIRICLHSFNTTDEISALVASLAAI